MCVLHQLTSPIGQWEGSEANHPIIALVMTFLRGASIKIWYWKKLLKLI